MSTKLVKKLLQVTATASIDASLAESQIKKKKRGKRSSVNETPLPVVEEKKKETMVRHHISTLVGLDQAMASIQTKSGRPSKGRGLNRKNSSKLPTKKVATKPIVLGNSRSSSSALQNQPLQPTVQKRAYQKLRKQKKLQDIAKLLQKTKKKMAKSNLSKPK
jgi:hypothetical protein